MTDRLSELLREKGVLCGVICRDPTPIEIELLAQAGCHVTWVDMEHAPFNPVEAAALFRTIVHLGMVPLVRLVDLTRTHVQLLLDAGAQNLLLPDIRNAAQARELVRLAKYPPVGERGVSSTSAAYDYRLGDDVRKTLQEANAATHLMVQVESDEGLCELDAICAVDGIDMATVGPADWAVGLGLYGPERDAIMSDKADAVIAKASVAGKIIAMTTDEEEQARRYVSMGVRMLFAGVDVNLKRRAFAGALASLQAATQQSC